MAGTRHLAQDTGIRQLGPGIEFNMISAIFEYLPHGLAFVDPDLTIRAANKAFAEMAQRPLREIIGHAAGEVIPGFMAMAEPIFSTVHEAGWPRSCQIPEQRGPDLAYWDYVVLPVFEPDGALDGFLLAHREATGRAH